VSLLVHPWRLFDSTRQTSQEVERQLHAEIDALAEGHTLEAYVQSVLAKSPTKKA